VAAPGTNLLLNSEATVGAASAQGWDAVTIPGWQAAGGLPTVVRYGTPGFPKTAKSWPGNRGNLFAGGAGGTAKLVQQTSVTPNARYDIAGWLGGTTTSAAELAVQFTGASGRILATAASDANYRALAGGSAFGVPLTDPEEETRSIPSTPRTSGTS